jgi:PAS domain S-box-containing protein
MEKFHNLLKRQLKRCLGDPLLIPPEWKKFVDAVNDAYAQFDADRNMLERSLDLSSLELLSANAEMRALIHSFPDLLFRIDSTGKILDYKAGRETALFFSPKNIIGKKIQSIPIKDISAKFQNAIERVLDTETIVSIDYPLFKRGYEYFYEARLSPLPENQIMVVIRDITKRKQAEEEKEKLKMQLLQSQKMEAIGQLAGGVAHDFNNILTVIMGCAYYLKEEMKDDDPLKLEVNDILASTERAASLVKSLLAFSRKQVMNPIPVNLNEIIQRMQRLLARVMTEDIELKTMLTDRNLVIMADPGQVEQALMNLAANAKDAMPEGGILTMSTDFTELDDEYINMHGYGKTGAYAVIIVSDTGRGIDENTRARIFEPFFTTKETGKGTGIGLAMVYGIIKQHNGYINVYSEPGEGTTFIIYLPLVHAKVEEVGPEGIYTAEKGTETLLLAEDNKDVRKYIKTMLGKNGYEVIEAENGEDAVNKFLENQNRIHLLLFDVIMPKKNGKEAYDIIKKIRPDIKALFMSGYTADAIDRKGLMEEGLNLILKPVLPSALFKNIREVLRR